MFRTILADGGIRDLNAQLGEFGLNAWAVPRGVGLPHLPYQRDEVAVEGGSSIAYARFPTPEEAKAKAMPSDDGLGLEEEQGVWPLWPEAPKTNPKKSVGGVEVGAPGFQARAGNGVESRRAARAKPQK